MNTTLDHLRYAALCLARSGPIKDRITEAYRNHLAHVEERDLPKELLEEFRAVHDALNRERALLPGEDTFRATVRKMSSTEAERIASSIVQLFGAMSGSVEYQSSLNSIVSHRVVSSWRA